MDKMQLGIVTLIRSGVTGEMLDLPDEFDIDAACELLARHHVLSLLYMGAMRCGVEKNLPAMRKLFQSYCRYMLKSEAQMSAVEQLCAAFDSAGVDYMPLKGCNLKGMYRKPELRMMGDADILVRDEQRDKIDEVMRTLEYKHVTDSDHEIVWSSEALTVELHKRLMPSYNKDYHRYYGNGWQLAQNVGGHKYAMKNEDEFIYVFTHFAKHYRDGGIGCRHIADLWVYRWANPSMDEEYILRELDKLQLRSFYENIKRTLSVWFEGAPSDEKTDFITKVILTNGSWGTKESHQISAVTRYSVDAGGVNRGKLSRILQIVFLPYEYMCGKYPILKKCPILLPALWVVRWVKGLFCSRDKLKGTKESLDFATSERVDMHQKSLSYVGLEFNFKE